MNTCPHCQAEATGFWGKWFSSIAHPITCPQCDGLSVVPVVASSGTLVACILGFVGLGLVAAIFKSTSPFWIGAPLVFCFYLWRWRSAPLVPASATAAGDAKKANWILGTYFAFLSLFH